MGGVTAAGVVGTANRRRARGATRVASVLAMALLGAIGPSPAAAVATGQVRAAYFYEYMTIGHLDTLAQVGFNRALVHHLADTLSAASSARLARWVAHGDSIGIDVVAQWAVQSLERQGALDPARRYTWGKGKVEPDVACPLDSMFWQSCLFDRAEEFLAAVPSLRRVAIDLEINTGGVKHYTAGPCRCGPCLLEYTRATAIPTGPNDAWRLSGLMTYEEARLTAMLTAMFTAFAARHPGVAVGVMDLDHDSFVNRSAARALARSGVPTVDYTERSYSVGGSPLAIARARLDALGLKDAPLVGGLWLRRFAPNRVPTGIRSILGRSQGYYVFTTYSLWLRPPNAFGPYALQGRPSEYWKAFREVNLP